MRLLFLLLLLCLPALAQDKLTEHTYKLSPGQKPPEATIGLMRWWASTWSGEGTGGFSQETWSEPMQGTMMGMFRQIKDAKVTRYAFMTLAEEGGTVVLRVQHLTPLLVADPGSPPALRYLGKKGDAILFEGVTFIPDGRGAKVYVALKDKSEWVYEYARSR